MNRFISMSKIYLVTIDDSTGHCGPIRSYDSGTMIDRLFERKGTVTTILGLGTYAFASQDDAEEFVRIWEENEQEAEQDRIRRAEREMH